MMVDRDAGSFEAREREPPPWPQTAPSMLVRWTGKHAGAEPADGRRRVGDTKYPYLPTHTSPQR